MPEMDTARGIIVADELPPFPEPTTTTAAREQPAPAASVTGTPEPAAFVTGTVTEAYTDDVGSGGRETFSDDVRGFEVTGGGVDLMRQVVEWSDPRLPTDLWLALDYTLIRDGADGSGGALNNATRSVLEDEAGRWGGTGRYVMDADQAFSFYELTGEAAYEGLHALMHGAPVADAQGPWDMAYAGYIFEAELTPFPTSLSRSRPRACGCIRARWSRPPSSSPIAPPRLPAACSRAENRQ